MSPPPPPPPLPPKRKAEPKQDSFCSRLCVGCGHEKGRADFSKTQWKKQDNAKCKACTTDMAQIQQQQQPQQRQQQQQQDASSTEALTVSLNPRPQYLVPGFEESCLTVCSDWPRTRNGKPPAAQSVIFNPLLACALGEPLQGHCSVRQIDLAIQWWSLAFSAWPNWVQVLRPIVTEHRDVLLASAKGKPNDLIPRHNQVSGTVPHFAGRLQVELLELLPEVALQVYASVTCLYSCSATATQDNNNNNSTGQQD